MLITCGQELSAKDGGYKLRRPHRQPCNWQRPNWHGRGDEIDLIHIMGNGSPYPPYTGMMHPMVHPLIVVEGSPIQGFKSSEGRRASTAGMWCLAGNWKGLSDNETRIGSSRDCETGISTKKG
jgi:hypothetical protein